MCFAGLIRPYNLCSLRSINCGLIELPTAPPRYVCSDGAGVPPRPSNCHGGKLRQQLSINSTASKTYEKILPCLHFQLRHLCHICAVCIIIADFTKGVKDKVLLYFPKSQDLFFAREEDINKNPHYNT